MKKIAILFIILTIVVVCIISLVLSNNSKQQKVKQENSFYDSYLNKEIEGTTLATIINKAMNNNANNDVNIDEHKRYINNNTNSISIDIKMIDTKKTYSMEQISNGQISNFVSYYGSITFKCTKIDYHKETGKVKYMLFEQITY